MSQLRLGAWTQPILALVVGVQSASGALEDAVAAAFRNGADWLQLRDRRLETRAFLDWALPLARAARQAAGPRPIAILVNRRGDVARAIAADGVHLGFDALSSEEARTLLGDDALVGVSAHYKDEIDPALLPGADYVHFAPVFDPLSKPAEREPTGLEELSAACSRGLPVLAQGGITATNATSAVGCGARGVAVTGAITEATNPGAATAELRAALDAA